MRAIAQEFDQSFIRLLLESGKLDRAALVRAKAAAVANDDPLHQVLCSLGLISERDMAEALASSLQLRLIEEHEFPQTALFESEITTDFLRNAKIIPISADTEAICVAMANPLDRAAIDALELLFDKPVNPAVAIPIDIDRQIARLYGQDERKNQAISAAPDAAFADVEQLKDLASDAPVVRTVNNIISKAVADRASDIHMEIYPDVIGIRERVDGRLIEIEAPPRELYLGIVSRIKILAGLNIVERRLPQDGRFRTNTQGRTIDVRVSFLPTMHGESVALRILDKLSAPMGLKELGFNQHVSSGLDSILQDSGGILLVTGPTGSGKTTTLYSALQRLNTRERNLVTIEDPVEYEFSGIRQIQIRPQINLNFSNVLRSVLRHDPDIIMVGEIRDTETAQIAIQAALTGHLVLSTLHTNNAATAITRLIDLGVQPYLIASAVKGVIAQRLVRQLCTACRVPYRGSASALAETFGREPPHDQPLSSVFEPHGCEKCNFTGYLGRACVAEFLDVNRTVRDAILNRNDTADLEAIAIREGMKLLRTDAMSKVFSGVTSIEEVLRVTDNVTHAKI